MTDKRTAQRLRVLKSGKIEFGGGAIDCTVRNLSERGAALEVASHLGIPEDFTLFIAGEGLQKAAHIVWRKEKRIGITFK